jgi:translation initiation factor 3 subunit H
MSSTISMAQAAREALLAQQETAQANVPAPQPVKDMADHVVNLEGLDPELLVSKPLEEVELDALVVLKIIKHCRDNYPDTAYGQLLGLDVAGVLEVTNCFPVTSSSSKMSNSAPLAEDDDGGFENASSGANRVDMMDGAEYQLQMLRCLRKLNFDASSVGLYVSTHLGSFWNQTIIENQYSYQSVYAQSVLLVYDPTKTLQGNLSLRALRLSDTFMALFKDKKFTMEALHAHKLTASGIFESLPIRIRNSSLLNALLQELESKEIESSASFIDRNQKPSSKTHLVPSLLTPNLDALQLGTESYLERHLEYLGETVDEYGQEQWRWQGWNRSLQKEQQRFAAVTLKKRAENASLVAQGLPLAHSEEDILTPSPALAKILANEPSRLETLIISNQIDTYCKQINHFAGPGLTKIYLAKAFQQ